MDRKRWIAVIITLVVCVGTVIIALVVPTQSLSLSTFFGNSNTLNEVVIEKKGSKKIVQLNIEGTMVDLSLDNQSKIATYNHANVISALNKISDDSSVVGVLLTINSPGGGVYETKEVSSLIQSIVENRHIPVYISVASESAGGAYYVACNATKLFAESGSSVGGISAIAQEANYANLLQEAGLSTDSITVDTETHNSIASGEQVLQDSIDSAYSDFIAKVATGREMSESDAEVLGDGRLYNSEDAKRVGLIDVIGTSEEALTSLRNDKELKNASLVEYQTSEELIENSVIGNLTTSSDSDKTSDTETLIALINALGTPNFPKLMYLYNGGE